MPRLLSLSISCVVLIQLPSVMCLLAHSDSNNGYFQVLFLRRAHTPFIYIKNGYEVAEFV